MHWKVVHKMGAILFHNQCVKSDVYEQNKAVNIFHGAYCMSHILQFDAL